MNLFKQLFKRRKCVMHQKGLDTKLHPVITIECNYHNNFIQQEYMLAVLMKTMESNSRSPKSKPEDNISLMMFESIIEGETAKVKDIEIPDEKETIRLHNLGTDTISAKYLDVLRNKPKDIPDHSLYYITVRVSEPTLELYKEALYFVSLLCDLGITVKCNNQDGDIEIFILSSYYKFLKLENIIHIDHLKENLNETILFNMKLKLNDILPNLTTGILNKYYEGLDSSGINYINFKNNFILFYDNAILTLGINTGKIVIYCDGIVEYSYEQLENDTDRTLYNTISKCLENNNLHKSLFDSIYSGIRNNLENFVNNYLQEDELIDNDSLYNNIDELID